MEKQEQVGQLKINLLCLGDWLLAHGLIRAKWAKPVVITYSRTFCCPPAWYHSTAVQIACSYMVMLLVPRWKVGSTLKEAALLCPSSSYLSLATLQGGFPGHWFVVVHVWFSTIRHSEQSTLRVFEQCLTTKPFAKDGRYYRNFSNSSIFSVLPLVVFRKALRGSSPRRRTCPGSGAQSTL